MQYEAWWAWSVEDQRAFSHIRKRFDAIEKAWHWINETETPQHPRLDWFACGINILDEEGRQSAEEFPDADPR